MLTRHELSIAIECAERYPAGVTAEYWGYGECATRGIGSMRKRLDDAVIAQYG